MPWEIGNFSWDASEAVMAFFFDPFGGGIFGNLTAPPSAHAARHNRARRAAEERRMRSKVENSALRAFPGRRLLLKGAPPRLATATAFVPVGCYITL